MKLMAKKGFTLVELLVVIAIIGILATGAVWVYTSQLEKARDSTRVTDLNNLRSAVEQFYQDKSEYPVWNQFLKKDNDVTVASFLQKLPKDPKYSQNCSPNSQGKQPKANTVCDIAYTVNVNENGIEKWAYELSVAFENAWNASYKADNTKDWWNDDNRYEHFVWNDKEKLNTNVQNKKKEDTSGDNDWTADWSAILLIRWEHIGKN